MFITFDGKSNIAEVSYNTFNAVHWDFPKELTCQTRETETTEN